MSRIWMMARIRGFVDEAAERHKVRIEHRYDEVARVIVVTVHDGNGMASTACLAPDEVECMLSDTVIAWLDALCTCNWTTKPTPKVNAVDRARVAIEAAKEVTRA